MQPTYDAGSGNGTWATLVGGACSHHCAIPAPEDKTRRMPNDFTSGLGGWGGGGGN